MQDSYSSIPPVDPWLSRFAKLVVLLTFWLIFIGGHTTTTGAGMAFPDWPLSNGSVNPAGWWENMMMRLEHGHRWTAGPVGILVGILCAWIWRSRWSVPVALLSAALSGFGASLIAKPLLTAKMAIVVMSLTGIVVSAIVFWLLLTRDAKRDSSPRPWPIRLLAYGAFLGVCAQAILGGLRVVLDPQGIAATDTATATAFRVVHGCFAQVELCVLVVLAAQLSPMWPAIRTMETRLSRLAWVTVGVVFLQLIVGATMRHMGAGLAITTFPQASATGSWMPSAHSTAVDLNFTHTRVGAVLVTTFIAVLAFRTIKLVPQQAPLLRPALALIALVVVQITLGLTVIWHVRPPMITTLHVVNGAAILSTAVLLAARLGRASQASNQPLPTPHPNMLRATA